MIITIVIFLFTTKKEKYPRLQTLSWKKGVPVPKTKDAPLLSESELQELNQ